MTSTNKKKSSGGDYTHVPYMIHPFYLQYKISAMNMSIDKII